MSTPLLASEQQGELHGHASAPFSSRIGGVPSIKYGQAVAVVVESMPTPPEDMDSGNIFAIWRRTAARI